MVLSGSRCRFGLAAAAHAVFGVEAVVSEEEIVVESDRYEGEGGSQGAAHNEDLEVVGEGEGGSQGTAHNEEEELLGSIWAEHL